VTTADLNKKPEDVSGMFDQVAPGYDRTNALLSETQTIQNFVLENNPIAVIFWHSQANAVYASECEQGILPETLDIMNTYAEASGYPAIATFDSYEVTGDAEGWLAFIGIPAITVELKTHEDIDWEQNLAGIKALFNYYNQPDNIR